VKEIPTAGGKEENTKLSLYGSFKKQSGEIKKMKKIIATAVGLVLAGGVCVTTASAVESQFGGYWRTRMYSQTDFKPGQSSLSNVDTRTRLYYTAKFSDDFKFVNKFEFNNTWGDQVGGDIGADGMGIWRIKNSYVDFNLGMANVKLGTQGGNLGRSFIFADDFSGAVVTGNFGDVSVPVLWARVEGEDASSTTTANEDLFGIMPSFKVGDMVKLNPYFIYLNRDNGSEIATWYLGADVDLTFDGGSAWGTFIYNGGTIDDPAGLRADGLDCAGYLVAVGGSFSFFHGQFFYASGDNNSTDGNYDAFVSAPGQSYYWSEIMGYGTFDNQVSNGSPADKISNIMAFNAGVTYKASEKLTLSADYWYAALAEDNAAGNTDLGNEIDVKVSYMLMDNLNLDLIGAYLFAGDATGDDDPTEIGAQFSLKF
jgi:hypothetical protein